MHAPRFREFLPLPFANRAHEAHFMDTRTVRIKKRSAILCLCCIFFIICETIISSVSSTSNLATFDLMLRVSLAFALFVTTCLVNFWPEVSSACAFTAVLLMWPGLTMDQSESWLFRGQICTDLDHFHFTAMFVLVVSFVTLVPARVRHSFWVPCSLPVSFLLWTLPCLNKGSAVEYLRLLITSVLLFFLSMLLVRFAVLHEKLERQVFISVRTQRQEPLSDTEFLNKQQEIDGLLLEYLPCQDVEDRHLDFDLSDSDAPEENQCALHGLSGDAKQVELDVCRYVNQLVLKGWIARLEKSHHDNTKNIVTMLQAGRAWRQGSLSSNSQRDGFATESWQRKQSTHSQNKAANICDEDTFTGSEDSLDLDPMWSKPTSPSAAKSSFSRKSRSAASGLAHCIGKQSSSDSRVGTLPAASRIGHSPDCRLNVAADEHRFDGDWQLAEGQPDASQWVRRLMIYSMDVIDGEGRLRKMERNSEGETLLKSGIMEVRQGQLCRCGKSGTMWVYKFVGPPDLRWMQDVIIA